MATLSRMATRMTSIFVVYQYNNDLNLLYDEREHGVVAFDTSVSLFREVTENTGLKGS